MGSTGDYDTDTERVTSFRSITIKMRNTFPDRSYNFGTLVLYLERLRERKFVAVVRRQGKCCYHLTRTGFFEAKKVWDERYTLGYVDPSLKMLRITAQDFQTMCFPDATTI